MKVVAIQTRKFLPPKDQLEELLNNIQSLEENSIIAVTSKVVAIAEGRCIKITEHNSKDQIAIDEADKYLPREMAPDGLILHTIKNNMLVASSGVDESNGDGYYILWPKNPQSSAKQIWTFLKNKFKIQNLGIIITDSRLVPLRRGVVGIAIAFFGFKPLKDYRNSKDIFGREFKMETSNIPDSIASAAVWEMGEGKEQQPIAVVTDLKGIEFINKEFRPNSLDESFEIPEKEDMFYPLLSSVAWKKGNGGIKD